MLRGGSAATGRLQPARLANGRIFGVRHDGTSGSESLNAERQGPRRDEPWWSRGSGLCGPAFGPLFLCTRVKRRRAKGQVAATHVAKMCRPADAWRARSGSQCQQEIQRPDGRR